MTMTEAFIYDAIRTPRGRGKKTGSLYGLRNVYRQFVPDDQWFKLGLEPAEPAAGIR